MSKVITFSRVFPAYHPKAGQPTYFVEKIWQSIYIDAYIDCVSEEFDFSLLYNIGVDIYAHDKYAPKHHTIRAGHRFKAGDWFSPRVWGNDINPKTGRSGPYHSNQIVIGPDIQVKQTWDFDIHVTDFYLNGRHQYALTGEGFDFKKVATNDGLSTSDLYDWFCMSPDFKRKKLFSGQIICWNENVKY